MDINKELCSVLATIRDFDHVNESYVDVIFAHGFSHGKFIEKICGLFSFKSKVNFITSLMKIWCYGDFDENTKYIFLKMAGVQDWAVLAPIWGVVLDKPWEGESTSRMCVWLGQPEDLSKIYHAMDARCLLRVAGEHKLVKVFFDSIVSALPLLSHKTVLGNCEILSREKYTR